MPRYKPQERDSMLLPVVLAEQIVPGSFAFALKFLVDHELDLKALDRRFKNDVVGASAYDPRVMLKIVLFAYSQGLISSRTIERACVVNVQFIALSGDSHPSHAHIAKFVSSLGEQIKPLFAQVLMTCDAQGLIGRDMFAIDGVKLPSNASKERSGTHEALRHRAERLDQAAAKIVKLHQAQDAKDDDGTSPPTQDTKAQARIEALRKEAKRTREVLATQKKRLNAKGQELMTNVTDPDSAKMATSKGVIQGYAAQAAVDAKHQVIVAAEVVGSGSEQRMLLPMIERTKRLRTERTVVTADAGYHSDANVKALHDQNIAALIADGQMRRRDERLAGQAKHKAKGDPLYDKRPTLQATEPSNQADGEAPMNAAQHGAQSGTRPITFFKPSDFTFSTDDPGRCTCPAGKQLTSSGAIHNAGKGLRRETFRARPQDCADCAMRSRCLRSSKTAARKVSKFHPRQIDRKDPSHRMREAIDSPLGRRLYSQRIALVEPVFANIRHNKRMSRFNLRGQAKVSTHWNLYCMVHNIEKLANNGWLLQ